MGADITIVAQKCVGGNWVDVEGVRFSEGPAPFDWRSYAMFGFLADVRNYSAIDPISEPRGLPSDYVERCEWFRISDLYSQSWLSVEELERYDYGQIIEDRRVTVQTSPNTWHGGNTAEPGGGKKMSLREFLGEQFFADLETLCDCGAERVVFGFSF